jgi:septal ring factor EnvC (AmiA/AmiB activator)
LQLQESLFDFVLAFLRSGRQTPPPSEGSLRQVKVEFERCLQNYRQKQAQVRKLQEDNMTVKKEMTESRRKFENLNLTLKQERERIVLLGEKVAEFQKGQGQKTQLEQRLERDVEKLETERLELIAEVEVGPGPLVVAILSRSRRIQL